MQKTGRFAALLYLAAFLVFFTVTKIEVIRIGPYRMMHGRGDFLSDALSVVSLLAYVGGLAALAAAGFRAREMLKPGRSLLNGAIVGVLSIPHLVVGLALFVTAYLLAGGPLLD